MSTIIFADGTLEETTNEFIYRYTKSLLKTELDLVKIKSANDTEDAYYCSFADVVRNDVVLRYEKEREYSTLSFLRNINDLKMKRVVAIEIVKIFEAYEHSEFRILPVPENFYFNNEGKVKFLYKATENMPITGFDRNDMLSHVIRLLEYVFSNKNFKELIKGRFDSKDSLIQSIQGVTSYEQLLNVLEDRQEVRKMVNVEPTKTKQEAKKEVASATEKTERTPKAKNKKERKSMNLNFNKKLVLGLSSLLALSIATNGYFITVKEVKPRMVEAKQSKYELIEKENELLKKKASNNSSEIKATEKQLSNSQEQLKKSKEELEKKDAELKEVIKQLKVVIEQNKQLNEKVKTQTQMPNL
ncbi:hypothetical protein [Bacillus sp. BS98]|uniref:hypothetical protein n=1 Tax=Bacillus sp. BS98 TaxID=2608254 RepID=UPI00122F74C6|nr:hypothetical protein [Bacillus sp. BS98]QEQ20793.1 hypothetical protein F0362_30110 [Bacillus sp. BS98]